MFHVEPSSHTTLTQCPVCTSTGVERVEQCNDHFLTGEEFSLMRCKDCELWFTNPVPPPEGMARYYQSEAYISHSSTSTGLISKIYRIVRSMTLRTKYRLVARYKPQGSILDIGCGTGHLLREFSQRGWITKGIEPGVDPRQFAVSTFGLDVEDEPALNNLNTSSFDVISMWHVLEHVHDPVARMNQVHRLLKADGIVVVALPNHSAWDATQYGSFWAAWDVPRHLLHFNQSAFLNLAHRSGFTLLKTLPMKYDAYYVSLLSEGYQHGKKRVISALRNGWKSNRKAAKSGEYSSLIYMLRKG
jgi:SAM-dependent methyltransferase